MSSKSPEIKKIFDKILMLIAVYAGPIMTVPQVWEIYVNNKVEGVSLISWLSYAVVSVIWTRHGWKRKDISLLINNTIYAILCSMVAIGVLLHK